MFKVYIKRLLNVYCEIFGTRSYGVYALASSCGLRHMNSCRIFHNIHSITYKYGYLIFILIVGYAYMFDLILMIFIDRIFISNKSRSIGYQ